MSYVVGFHAVREVLLSDPTRVKAFYYAHGRRDARVQELLSLVKEHGLRFESVERRWLDDRAEGVHQGVAVLCQTRAIRGEAELEVWIQDSQRPLLILVLEGVTDTRNFGACLRSAAAAGAGAVIVPARNSAPLNDAAEKAAAGAASIVPVFQVTNLARTLKSLKAAGVWLVGTAGDAEKEWDAPDYTADTAILMGSEGKGLKRLTRELCDHLVRIPMAGGMESLNVSAAASVLLFEAVRQRRG